MLLGDDIIASFIEDDRRIVPVVYDSIAHEFQTLLPPPSRDIFLGIAGRHSLYKSQTVEGTHILLRGRNMHPPEEIAVTLQHEAIGVVAHPRRNRNAHSRPLVRGTLGKALELQHPVIEVEHAVTEGCLAEACLYVLPVCFPAINADDAAYGIKVSVAP